MSMESVSLHFAAVLSTRDAIDHTGIRRQLIDSHNGDVVPYRLVQKQPFRQSVFGDISDVILNRFARAAYFDSFALDKCCRCPPLAFRRGS